MKIKIKVIDSGYDEKFGVSKVTIATDLGIFKGEAFLHPEDEEIASKYAGCRYAEMRASIKYMKEKAKIAKIKLDTTKKIFNNFNQMKNFDKNSRINRMLKKEIYFLEDEVETFNRNIKTLKEKLKQAIDNRPNIIKEINEKKNKDNK